MNMELTAEQRRILQQNGERPQRIVDTEASKAYVLVPYETYERVKALFEDDPITPEEKHHRLRAFGERAGWNDPAMDIYNDLDPRRSL